jgi:hypothetical protein
MTMPFKPPFYRRVVAGFWAAYDVDFDDRLTWCSGKLAIALLLTFKGYSNWILAIMPLSS